MEEKFDPRGEEKEEEEEEEEEREELELVLFQVNECYVYLIPPRKSTSSYRADEWNVNKWTWEGALKVVSKGEECIIKLEDHSTGELYARAFLRKGEPHPVEAVIDSSRYFVLRIEENFGGRIRHAFIGIGFRERTQAYDFQAALHDHMKYLNKKQAAEEMEQTYTTKASVDYSLKEGEKLILQLNNKGTHSIRPLEETRNSLSPENDVSLKDTVCSLKPPPPPQTKVQALSRTDVQVVGKDQSNAGTMNKLNGSLREDGNQVEESREQSGVRIENDLCEVDDDFGDFQTA